MPKVIIHISDLHVSLFTMPNGTPNSRLNSYLSTKTDTSDSLHFIDTFINKIQNDFKEHEYILLITGDITDTGETEEFKYASLFLRRIIEKLKISLKNCLILPGDHDVHRRSLDNELEINPTNQAHLLHNIKFRNFSNFYFNVKEKTFSYDKIIIDNINIENKIILLGINSNFRINNVGGLGYIPVETFKNELEELKAQFSNPNLHYIACWHHNFSAGYDNTNSGQWDIENRKHLLSELERQNIKLVFTGNEHTSNSKSILLDNIISSDCGALTAINSDATFKMYPIDISSDIVLKNKIYALQKPNGNDFSFFWNIRENLGAKQPEKFELFIKNTQNIPDVEDNFPHIDENEHNPITKSEILDDRKPVVYSNSSISEKLYGILKEKKIFHSGHFHWSESSRAHNWIDVSKLLENKEDLYFVNNAIIDIIETFKLNEECDLIIGLGYEGNIISSKASIKFNLPYTSLPYSYRYNDYHDYEKKLNFTNEDGRFKKVIIITDVVNDGRTIRKLIDKHEKDFFEKVEKIIVISLFYTGYQDINNDILNFNMLPKDHDFENDYLVNNIEFYTVKSLRVEKCPYGKNYREECFIFKDELSCVHLFYDNFQ